MDKGEAMKILKDFHDKSALFSVRTALETLHPEIKEYEDEKIRKAICYILNHSASGLIDNTNFTVSQMEDWLEKQGEQILANSCKTCKNEQKPIKWDEYDEMYVAALVTMVKNHCTTDDKLKNELIGWLVSLKTSIK